MNIKTLKSLFDYTIVLRWNKRKTKGYYNTKNVFYLKKHFVFKLLL